mmetsp:Transcript_57055/g.121237  ORF Transcript_57055/g.121237 Transcript_57055/m.121237 type:complete len:226 (+) Transcript_57055:426-1103(+)
MSSSLPCPKTMGKATRSLRVSRSASLTRRQRRDPMRQTGTSSPSRWAGDPAPKGGSCRCPWCEARPTSPPSTTAPFPTSTPSKNCACTTASAGLASTAFSIRATVGQSSKDVSSGLTSKSTIKLGSFSPPCTQERECNRSGRARPSRSPWWPPTLTPAASGWPWPTTAPQVPIQSTVQGPRTARTRASMQSCWFSTVAPTRLAARSTFSWMETWERCSGPGKPTP